MWKDAITNALNAATYHEIKAFYYASPQISDYNKVVFHLRSYYWELWSIWDYILQTVNSQTLKLSPDRVREDFIKKLTKQYPNYEYLNDLIQIDSNPFLERIGRLRNYAHKWQINPYQIEHNKGEVTIICIDNLDYKDRKLSSQINVDRNDLWFMNKAVEDLIKRGLFK
jgi:hypothetical protein